jgi:hypothetical protein
MYTKKEQNLGIKQAVQVVEAGLRMKRKEEIARLQKPKNIWRDYEDPRYLKTPMSAFRGSSADVDSGCFFGPYML